MLLAAMARETRRIGLGFGIIPLPIHDPVRVAERLATLDALSGGRVLWGSGAGSRSASSRPSASSRATPTATGPCPT